MRTPGTVGSRTVKQLLLNFSDVQIKPDEMQILGDVVRLPKTACQCQTTALSFYMYIHTHVYEGGTFRDFI